MPRCGLRVELLYRLTSVKTTLQEEIIVMGYEEGWIFYRYRSFKIMDTPLLGWKQGVSIVKPVSQLKKSQEKT